MQGVKKGIMEVADMVVVNKSDGELIPAARHSANDFRRALQLARRKHKAWEPKVKRCSALTADGVDRVWAVCTNFFTTMTENGELQRKRTEQGVKWMWSQFESQVLRTVRGQPEVSKLASHMQEELSHGRVTARHAAHALFDSWVRR